MDVRRTDGDLHNRGLAHVRPGHHIDRHQAVFWLGALLVLLVALAVFKDILLPFVSGILLAYFLNPLTDKLERLGLGRTIAAGLLVGIFGTLLVVGIVLLAPIVAAQIETLAKSLPGGIERARKAVEAMARERLGNHFTMVQAAIDRAVAELQTNGNSLVAAAASKCRCPKRRLCWCPPRTGS